MHIDLVSMGKAVAVHGLQGELIVLHNLGKKTDLAGVEVLLVEQSDGSRIPYFIESAAARSEKELVLKLEAVSSREAAQGLLKKTIWMKQQDFQKHASGNAPISLLGFSMVEEGTVLGMIEQVIEQPHQLLCTLYIQNKEVLIPLHEESLVKIDRRKKQVHVRLPDGLLEIYLG
jgi:16S rRNA processing protein RimM